MNQVEIINQIKDLLKEKTLEFDLKLLKLINEKILKEIKEFIFLLLKRQPEIIILQLIEITKNLDFDLSEFYLEISVLLTGFFII